mgnify:CR=1 FL=1
MGVGEGMKAMKSWLFFVIVLSASIGAAGTAQRYNRVETLPGGADLRTGDVILLGSESWRGRFILALDRNSDYAHIGLVEVCSNNVFIIHADPDQNGVACDVIGDYLRSNIVSRLLLLRVDAARGAANNAVKYAREQWRKKKPFDGTFRYGKGKGLYCTELVLRAYDFAGIKLLPDVKDGDRIFPSEVIKSGCVSKIAEWGRPK